MKTAGLVKISPSRNVDYTSAYNLQGSKTVGHWRNDPTPLKQRDLISFCGNSNLPGLTVQQRGLQFVDQSEHNLELAQRLYPQNTVSRHANWSSCHTIIQSFEYRANKNLSPLTVHAMGHDLFNQVKAYLGRHYGYSLDNGIISTHIDRDRLAKNYNPGIKTANREPHLHNHIVIPNYNARGQSIHPYMRKVDLYRFQHFNDNIVRHYGLNDYYFAKLDRLIRPVTAYTINPSNQQIRSSELSNLEKAKRTFKVANDRAWDEYHPTPVNLNAVFPKMVKSRDDYLAGNYGYESKKTHDRLTKKPKRVFTEGIFINRSSRSNLQTQWYNINNMRLLRWRTKKEMKAERVLWQLKFSRNILNTCVSFSVYQKTLKIATSGVPNVTTLTSSSQRKSHVYDLDHAYRIASKSEQFTKPTVNRITRYLSLVRREGYQLSNQFNPQTAYKTYDRDYLQDNVVKVANGTPKRNDEPKRNRTRSPSPQPSVSPRFHNNKISRSKSRSLHRDNGRER